eukprot:Opistho-2@11355
MAGRPEIPGPGAYELRSSKPQQHQGPFTKLRAQPIAPEAIVIPSPPTPPGPAHYNTAADPVQKRYISSSMFLSQTQRDEILARRTDAPGPGRYRPRMLTRHTSFNYNQTGTWV